MTGELLRVDIEDAGAVRIARVIGEVDISNAGTLQERLMEAGSPEAAAVVVDLTKTEYLDSAGIRTLFTVLAISAGHWLIMAAFCYLPLSMLSHNQGRGDLLQKIAKIEAGQTPPAVLAIFAFHKEDVEYRSGYRSRDSEHFLISGIVGVISWAGMAAIVWGITSARFRVVTGRQPIRCPEHRGDSRSRRPLRPLARSHPPARPRGAILIAEEVDDIPTVLPAGDDGPDEPRPRNA